VLAFVDLIGGALLFFDISVSFKNNKKKLTVDYYNLDSKVSTRVNVQTTRTCYSAHPV
jgi:hypothetical protein